MRSCDGCNKCCSGIFTETIREIPMYKGQPCFFMVANGCGDYENRPDAPCKSFYCGWVASEEIPLWMKPDQVNAVIAFKRTNGGEEYTEISESDGLLDSRVLSWWFKKYVNLGGINLVYELGGGWNWVGTESFCNAMVERFERSEQ